MQTERLWNKCQALLSQEVCSILQFDGNGKILLCRTNKVDGTTHESHTSIWRLLYKPK